MITAAVRIQTTSDGISVEQIALTDQSKASPEERAVAGIIDIGIKAAYEFVGRACGHGTMIEGKEIEDHVNALLKKHHTKSFHTQLKEAGINIPPQR